MVVAIEIDLMGMSIYIPMTRNMFLVFTLELVVVNRAPLPHPTVVMISPLLPFSVVTAAAAMPFPAVMP